MAAGTPSEFKGGKKPGEEEEPDKDRLQAKKKAEQEYSEMLKSQERIRCLKCRRKMVDCTCK